MELKTQQIALVISEETKSGKMLIDMGWVNGIKNKMKNKDTADRIITELTSLYNEDQSQRISLFFKTGKGEYGEGDRFLGVKVPVTRSIVKKYRNQVSLKDVENLINSPWHEIRLTGFLLLLELYKTRIKIKDLEEARALVNFYLENLDKGNNWDLVDLVSGYLLGDWLLMHPEEEKILTDLAGRECCLWHQRVAIVSTHALIRAGKFDMTLTIAEKFLTHPHDLIHKATGWMLREIGKRGGKKELVGFLEKYKSKMPRTMLRYAIEKFPEDERKYFMNKEIKSHLCNNPD